MERWKLRRRAIVMASSAYLASCSGSGGGSASVEVGVSGRIGGDASADVATGDSSAASQDPCEPNPCSNGGTCSVEGDSARCSCTPEFIGPACNVSVENELFYAVTRGTLDSSMPESQGIGSLDEHGFRFFCVPSHFSYDDPVVYPGLQGAAHLHMFYGNTGVTYQSTADSIANEGASSCDGGITNRSAYWVPALFDEDDNPVLPNSIILYYKSWVEPRSDIHPIPSGLQILASSRVEGAGAVAVAPPGQPEAVQGAMLHVTDFVEGHVPDGMVGVVFSVTFPNCVQVDENGDPVLTSPGGTSHVAYGPGGCPASHPYAIPTLTQNIFYAGLPYESGWYLASDPSPAEHGTTLHADYMAAWTSESAEIMAECIREGARECGPPPQRHHEDQFYAPDGTQIYDFNYLADGVDITPDAMNGWPTEL